MLDRRSIIAGTLLGLTVLSAARAIDPQDFDQIEQGRYLADLGDCVACHTRPGSGEILSGGRPIETPFGVLLAPNITPDPETGIGAWTDDEFVNSLTSGTGRNGMHLYPAIPMKMGGAIYADECSACHLPNGRGIDGLFPMLNGSPPRYCAAPLPTRCRRRRRCPRSGGCSMISKSRQSSRMCGTPGVIARRLLKLRR